MNHASFMSKMLRPTYVWRMASGLVPCVGAREGHPLVRSARTRMANAQREVDDLVLARAEAIRAECAVDTAPEGEVLVPDDTVRVEKLAHWLHGEYGGPFDWHRTEEHIRENYRHTARALMSQLPELFR